MAELISIIVPCYNQSQFLDQCLQSVLDQTYQNWECIIVNDGSPDNTEEIAKKWTVKDSRFRYLKKENGGLSSARNAGINIAKGHFIQFLDCDDLLEINKLMSHEPYMDQNIDISISGYRYFESDEGASKKRIFGRNYFLPEVAICEHDEVDLKELFKIKNPFVISAPLYRKKIFQKIGNFSELLTSLEDWEFNLRCAVNNYTFQHIGYPSKSFTLIRLHNSSMMRDAEKMQQNYKTFLEICNCNPKYLEAFGKTEIVHVKKQKTSNFRKVIKLLMPPILTIFVDKLLHRRKTQ